VPRSIRMMMNYHGTDGGREGGRDGNGKRGVARKQSGKEVSLFGLT
jgi:hypothetical protein